MSSPSHRDHSLRRRGECGFHKPDIPTTYPPWPFPSPMLCSMRSVRIHRTVAGQATVMLLSFCLVHLAFQRIVCFDGDLLRRRLVYLGRKLAFADDPASRTTW